MFKALSFAALIATTQAAWDSYSKSFNLVIGGKTYYTATVGYNVKVGYTTQYNAPTSPAAASPSTTESYGFNIFAKVIPFFEHEAMTSYKGRYDFVMNLLDVTPYGQNVEWTRFDNGEAFATTVSGYRYVGVADLMTVVTENAKTCSWNALASPAQSPAAPVCAYDSNTETKYVDPVWKFNAGEQIFTGDLAQWYGVQGWWSS